MTATEGRRGPGADVAPFVFLGAMLLIVAAATGAWLAAAAGCALNGRGVGPAANPFVFAISLVRGSYHWPGGWATVIAVVEVVVVLVVASLAAWQLSRRGKRPKIDKAGRYLGKGREISKLNLRGAIAVAARLGMASAKEFPGVFIGRSIPGGQSLFGSWEDMHVDIWGPRTGKTTRRAVPAILAAPGPVLATSNKRDIVDLTRGPRSKNGTVWVFDPQGRAKEKPTWWWNPLSYVTDVTTARTLGGHFAAGSAVTGAKTDAYFTPAGEDLLSWLLLAAAVDDQPITQVYTWLTRPKDDEPVRILRAAGHIMPADSVAGTIAFPEKQRGGIYGTALQMASCLVNPAIHPWITPGRGPKRPEFKPAEFALSKDTLYSLSREGKGSAGPLVTALTVAVVEAAEEAATDMRGGRLKVPMLGVLDEAANVCRWTDLPDLYSHYGSRGIILMTILQSWDQGVEVWGEKGMSKLWSAANVRVYGGGVSDARFLGDLSQFAGMFEVDTFSTSSGGGGQGGGLFGGSTSHSHSTRSEQVLGISDLSSMPQGRALVQASGTPMVLVETVPWWEGPHAEAVRASLALYDPGEKAA
ncbi:hypothetical protein GCM10010442_44010 [Kitasatospora kifunensis]